MWVSENDYVKKEYGWWWNYTEEEIETIRRRMNNPRMFNNNYTLEFLISGRSVFTTETIAAQRKTVLKVGDKVKLSDGSEHIVREEEGFRIYKPPEAGHFYVVGADCSEGVTGATIPLRRFWIEQTAKRLVFGGDISLRISSVKF